MGTGTAGVATIDFGATPTDEATVAVAEASITANSHVEVFIQADDTTADNNAEAHDALSYFAAKPVATDRNVGVGFTAVVRLWAGLANGTFKLHFATYG